MRVSIASSQFSYQPGEVVDLEDTPQTRAWLANGHAEKVSSKTPLTDRDINLRDLDCDEIRTHGCVHCNRRAAYVFKNQPYCPATLLICAELFTNTKLRGWLKGATSYAPKKQPESVGRSATLTTKTAVLNTLASQHSRRSYAYAIKRFIVWYCSEASRTFAVACNFWHFCDHFRSQVVCFHRRALKKR